MIVRMYRGVLLGLLLGGCNQVFDIEETRFVDGEEPPENPVCPQAGTAPIFRPDVREISSRNCFSYTTSDAADRATALCLDDVLRLEESEIDGQLAPAQFAPTPSDSVISKVWLAPEGDVLVAHQYAGDPSVHRIALYARQGDAWMWSADAYTLTNFISSGVPSAAPARRLIVSTLNDYKELAQQGSTWTEVRGGTWASIGAVGTGDSANLSPDGLRLTFTVNYTTMYTRRNSLDEAFPPAIEIETIGQGRDAFMTADCGKVYFSGISSVFYRYQL